MTTRSTLLAAAAATLILGLTDASPAAAAVPGVSFVCGPATKSSTSGEPKASSLEISIEGNDPTQTFTSGSKFTIKFEAESRSADVLAWQILDYGGIGHAAGSIDVPAGATVASMVCSSTRAGYFAVYAKLRASGATPAQQGSRPAGFVAFGVLPNLADYVPEFAASLDERRIGLQGKSYEEAGTGLQPVNENLGSTWVLAARSQSVTEPLRAGQYNPNTYASDPSIKLGTLARIVTIDGLPQWASTAPSADAVGTYPPRSFSSFQSYAALVGEESARLHSQYIPNQKKNYYQVTWEPDPGPVTQWMGSDSQFVALYKAVWEGVHSTDPDAQVMGPTTQNLPSCADWISRMAPLGYTKYLDAVACHGYYTLASSSSKPPEPADLPGQVQALRKTVVGLMPAGTKIFVTETGVSYPMGSRYSSSYPTAGVLREHAEAVVRTHLIMLGEGVDTSFLFYSADFAENVGFGMYFNLSMATHDFGSRIIEPKPAAMAVAAAARLIDGSRSLGALTNLPPGGYGYAFLLADKSKSMTALWAHNDSFDASASYELEVGSAGTSGGTMMFDTMGNPKEVEYSNGLLKVTLSEMPIYVLSSNVKATQAHLRAPEGYSTSF